MPPRSSIDQLRAMERRQALQDRSAWRTPDYRSGTYRSRQASPNTLGPQEDVIEQRRLHRNRVQVSALGSARHRNILLENLILLAFLAASIWGLYSLTLHLLAQA